MKRVIFIFLLPVLYFAPVNGQLKIGLNLPRAGDVIVKQQVEYKDPGRTGENVLWDFSRLNVVNPEYTLSYRLPKLSRNNTYILGLDTFPAGQVNVDDFITGEEHYTAYHYYLKDNQLFLLGHVNAVSQMHNEKPLQIMKYPFDYGSRFEDDYYSLTFYAGADPMRSKGNITVSSEASGMMILPDQDTLKHVTMIRTVRTIVEIPDTALLRKYVGREMPEPVNTRIENCLWYEKGYRYPVFETIRQFNENDSNSRDFFSTAFFYPPQEHYYLDTDPENRVIIETLKNGKPNPFAGSSFNAYPNPMTATLNVEIFIPAEAKIKIQVRSVANKSVYINENKGKFSSGTYYFRFDVSKLPFGYYLLSIWADNHLMSETMLKN